MSLIDRLKPVAKAVIGGLGITATVASAWYGADSTVGHVITVVVAIATGFGIWRVPNLDAVPAAVAALRAAQAKRRPPAAAA